MFFLRDGRRQDRLTSGVLSGRTLRSGPRTSAHPPPPPRLHRTRVEEDPTRVDEPTKTQGVGEASLSYYETKEERGSEGKRTETTKN